MTSSTCDLCGHWDSNLDDGVCSSCKKAYPQMTQLSPQPGMVDHTRPSTPTQEEKKP